MKINFKDSVVEWYDSKLPLRDPRGLGPEDFKEMEDSLYVQVEDILEVVNNQKQLNTAGHNDLFRILKNHESLFDGTLGVYPHRKFTLI